MYGLLNEYVTTHIQENVQFVVIVSGFSKTLAIESLHVREEERAGANGKMMFIKRVSAMVTSFCNNRILNLHEFMCHILSIRIYTQDKRREYHNFSFCFRSRFFVYR